MAFSVKDETTDAKVRELARLRGKGITETIREAVEKELRTARGSRSLAARLQSIGQRYSRFPSTGEKADKAFFDELGGP